MDLIDLAKRVNDRRKERGSSELSLDEVETLQIEARQAICEGLDAYFAKSYTIALVNGVGTLYNLSGSINIDLLWDKPGRAIHEDLTEVSILPFGCTARDLSYPRAFQGYYHAAIESEANTAIITVMQADGSTAAPDGNLIIDFATVKSLADWPQIFEPHLVAKCLELSANQQAEAA